MLWCASVEIEKTPTFQALLRSITENNRINGRSCANGCCSLSGGVSELENIVPVSPYDLAGSFPSVFGREMFFLHSLLHFVYGRFGFGYYI